LEYQLMMWAIETNNLVFIDESRTNLNMARTYARSKKGTRVHGCKPHNKGENLTIIAAISITGVIAALTVSLHRAVFRQIPIFQMASNSLF
ncbi:MAG: transposase, partial [Pseudanabaena sp.]